MEKKKEVIAQVHSNKEAAAQ